MLCNYGDHGVPSVLYIQYAFPFSVVSVVMRAVLSRYGAVDSKIRASFTPPGIVASIISPAAFGHPTRFHPSSSGTVCSPAVGQWSPVRVRVPSPVFVLWIQSPMVWSRSVNVIMCTGFVADQDDYTKCGDIGEDIDK